MTFAKKVIEFFKNLDAPNGLPRSVELLNPYSDHTVINYITQFYNQFYSDNQKRTFLIGINPGRLGGGITGIPFTDPIQLDAMSIRHDLQHRAELSSSYIYEMIFDAGGPLEFYKRNFITSVCPLGFIRDGKNLNYYDDHKLQKKLEPYIIEKLNMQVGWGAKPVAYSIGMGTNLKYLQKLNVKHQWFDSVKGLPHPRWIMQYRRKRMEEFKKMYIDTLMTD